MENTITVDEKEIKLFGKEDAEFLILQTIEERTDPEEIVSSIREKTDVPFLYAAITVEDWNRDLSPWYAEPVFGKEAFEGEALRTLIRAENVLADLKRRYPFHKVVLGGYSLAGLFAFYASYVSDSFDRIAAVSPSVWYDGFREFMESHECHAENVYLSLGDREHITKNKRMAAVKDNIEYAASLLKERAFLEYNPGNHFNDPAGRTAKGFAYLLNNERTQ